MFISCCCGLFISRQGFLAGRQHSRNSGNAFQLNGSTKGHIIFNRHNNDFEDGNCVVFASCISFVPLYTLWHVLGIYKHRHTDKTAQVPLYCIYQLRKILVVASSASFCPAQVSTLFLLLKMNEWYSLIHFHCYYTVFNCQFQK